MKRSNQWMTVRQSAIHAKGGFARTTIPKDTYIVRYIGKKITNKEADKISEQETKDNVLYLFGLNKRYTLDGSSNPRNIAKYINHSCTPNAESINEDGKIWILALKDIPKGEEITYDYQLETDDPKDHPCRCGSVRCKKYLTTTIYKG